MNKIFWLIIMAIMCTCQIIIAQYTHFNQQYAHGGGFHNAECFPDSAKIYGLYAGPSATYLNKSVINYLGEELSHQNFMFPIGFGLPPFNPNEAILKLSESEYIVIGAALECASNHPCLSSFSNAMEVNWSLELTDWLDCSTNSFGAGGLAKIDDTHFAMVTNARIQIDGQLDQFGYRLAIFDSDGNEVEQYTYFREDIPYNTIFGFEKTEGGYLVWGDCSGPQFDVNACVSDFINYVMRVDELGQVEDIYFFEDEDAIWDGCLSLEVLDNNKLFGIYAHNFEADCNIWKVRTKPRVVLLDSATLIPEWDYLIDIPELQDVWMLSMLAQDIVVATDSGFVATLQVQEGGYNVYTLVIKVTSTGELDWYRFLNPPNSPTETYVQSLIRTPDGGYLIGGTTNDASGPMWLIKLDACGYEVESGCPAIIGVEENEREQSTFWPNPVLNSLNAKLATTVSQIEISDMSGRVVFEEKVYFPRQQWDLEALAPGMYTIRTIHEDGSFEGTVVVKE